MNDAVPVTVIVPMRNAATTLRTALASVVAQRPPAAEVICIDGGSTDGGPEIAREFGIKVMAQRGQGLANARNEAIRASHEPWIAFCDADDRWAPDALSVRMHALMSQPAARAVIGRVVREALADVPATAAQQQLVGQPVPGFTPGAMVVHRTVFDAVGLFDETLSIGSDSEWFVRLQDSAWAPMQIAPVVLFKGVRAHSLSADVASYRRELLTVARRFITRRRGSTST